MSDLKNPSWPQGHFDHRNVIDYYKYWEHDAILADQDKNRCRLKIVAENFGNDFNISTVVRSSNAFLCNEVIIVGRRRWDRRGACGTHNYEHVSYEENVGSVITKHPKHRVVVLDNVPGASSIYDYKWHEDTLLVLGQESIGVSPESMVISQIFERGISGHCSHGILSRTMGRINQLHPSKQTRRQSRLESA